MKKFFLMLAVALPMFFMASCSDDKDENNNFQVPVVDWGLSTTAVKSEMANFGTTFGGKLSLVKEESDLLAYTSSATDGFPMYVYDFEDEDGLIASTLAVSEDQDELYDLDGFLKERYKEDGEDEYGYWFADKKKTLMVWYGYDEDADCIMAIWTPYSSSRADRYEIVKAQSETIKELRQK